MLKLLYELVGVETLCLCCYFLFFLFCPNSKYYFMCQWQIIAMSFNCMLDIFFVSNSFFLMSIWFLMPFYTVVIDCHFLLLFPTDFLFIMHTHISDFCRMLFPLLSYYLQNTFFPVWMFVPVILFFSSLSLFLYIIYINFLCTNSGESIHTLTLSHHFWICA